MRTPALKLLRLSLRELLALVVLLSLVLAGAVTGGGWFAIVLTIAGAIVSLYMLMQAIFGNVRSRASAIGFLLAGSAFWLSANVLTPASQLFHAWAQYGYAVPLDWGTSALAHELEVLLARSQVYDSQSDAWVASESDRGQDLLKTAGGSNSVPNFGGAPSQRVFPDHYTLLLLIRPAAFLLFGWLGARFASFAYDRRATGEATLPDGQANREAAV